MSPPVVPRRRDRLRAATLEEIRLHAYAQIERGGAAALSINGIAKAMGMSGAALYRYVPSRDALLSLLVSESYEDLAGALSEAHHGARRRTPEARLRVTLDGYRAWARAQPHRYRLIFESAYASGASDPERIVPPAQRAMDVVIEAPGAVGTPAEVVDPAVLRRELSRWGARSERPADPALLLTAVQAWTRLHGIVSLEIEGVFEQMGIDPRALYSDEVARLVARVRAPAG